MRKERSKSQKNFTTLRARASSEWYFDSEYSRHLIEKKSLLTSVKDFNGRNITFRNGSVAQVRGRGSISIPGCP